MSSVGALSKKMIKATRTVGALETAVTYRLSNNSHLKLNSTTLIPSLFDVEIGPKIPYSKSYIDFHS